MQAFGRPHIPLPPFSCCLPIAITASRPRTLVDASSHTQLCFTLSISIWDYLFVHQWIFIDPYQLSLSITLSRTSTTKTTRTHLPPPFPGNLYDGATHISGSPFCIPILSFVLSFRSVCGHVHLSLAFLFVHILAVQFCEFISISSCTTHEKYDIDLTKLMRK